MKLVISELIFKSMLSFALNPIQIFMILIHHFTYIIWAQLILN